MAVRHLSEWSDRGDFEVALNSAISPDFRGLTKAKRHELFMDQIQPFLWWGEGLVIDGLPSDMNVWSYHPITFVSWLHDRLSGPVQSATTIKDASAWGGKKPPDEIKDDASEGAEGFVDDEDALFGDAAKSLDLEKLAAGYPEDK